MIENKHLCILGVDRIPECGVSELPACPWMHHEPAPRSMFTCFVSRVPAQTCCPHQKVDFCLWEAFIWSYQLFFPPFGVLWTLSCEHIDTFFFFFFFVGSKRGKMTLKSNKNEPALTLDSVNSARTALSDLYLEQLLQNKPKSDQVAFSDVVILY